MKNFKRGDKVRFTHDLVQAGTNKVKAHEGERAEVLGNRGYPEVYDVWQPSRRESLTVNINDIEHI